MSSDQIYQQLYLQSKKIYIRYWLLLGAALVFYFFLLLYLGVRGYGNYPSTTIAKGLSGIAIIAVVCVPYLRRRFMQWGQYKQGINEVELLEGGLNHLQIERLTVMKRAQGIYLITLAVIELSVLLGSIISYLGQTMVPFAFFFIISVLFHVRMYPNWDGWVREF